MDWAWKGTELLEGMALLRLIHLVRPIRILLSSHFSYNVASDTPFCSRLYPNFHSSTSCSLGGTNNRISSASAFDNNLADCCVLSLYPFRLRGVSGGGWNGLAFRRGGVNTPSMLSML